PYEKRSVRPGHLMAKAPHLTNILKPSHPVNHTAGGKEQKSFEECMRHQMEYTRRKGARAAGEEHVSELADRGVSEHFFDIGLNETDRSGENCRERPYGGHNQKRAGRTIIDDGGSRDHVY